MITTLMGYIDFESLCVYRDSMGGSLEGVFLYWYTSKGTMTCITCLSTKDIPVRIVIIPKARKGGGILDL